MDVRELTREQLVQLKQRYMCLLADSGEFAEVFGRNYGSPSWGDLQQADEIVPDDVIFREYDGIIFVEEDFV